MCPLSEESAASVIWPTLCMDQGPASHSAPTGQEQDQCHTLNNKIQLPVELPKHTLTNSAHRTCAADRPQAVSWSMAYSWMAGRISMARMTSAFGVHSRSSKRNRLGTLSRSYIRSEQSTMSAGGRASMSWLQSKAWASALSPSSLACTHHVSCTAALHNNACSR